MRFKKSFIVLLLMIFATGAFAQESTGKPDTTSDRRWGLAASLFNQGVSELAVSKKLSRKTMLLLGLGFRWTGSESKQELHNPPGNTITYTTSSYSISIQPEWRRYAQGRERWALYYGVQPSFAYSRDQTERDTGSGDEPKSTKNTTLSWGLAATFGVEYALLRNLSVSIHFRPLTYSYSKRDEEPGTDVSSTRRANRLAFFQNTAVFLRIYF